MKKLVLFVGILFLLFAVSAFAQGQPWPDRSHPGQRGPLVLKDVTPTPPSNFVFSLDNLSGDFGLIYETNAKGQIAAGVGLDVLNIYQGLVTIRAQAFFPSTAVLAQNNAAIAGASVMVNLVKLTGMVPGTSWLATTINPSIGLFGGYDFVNGVLAGGPMLSIINIKF